MRTPGYRNHSSGQARVTLNGFVHYLGKHGSRESRERYDRLIADWLTNGRHVMPPAGASLTIAELAAVYRIHVKAAYGDRSNGKKTIDRVDRALKAAVRLFGSMPAKDFRPRALKTTRDEWIRAGNVRDQINKLTNELIGMFRWAASEEYLPGSVSVDLATVKSLRKGDKGTVEGEPRLPVPVKDFALSIRQLHDLLRRAAIVHWLTGMRPDELLSMRADEIDQSAAVWVYRPCRHKSQWRGHGREILLGPRAQVLLLPIMDGPGYIFNPQRIAKNPFAGERYQVGSYSQAIKRACIKAGVKPWVPYQLRHDFACRIANGFSADAARIMLGHRDLSMTQHYVKPLANSYGSDVARKVS